MRRVPLLLLAACGGGSAEDSVAPSSTATTTIDQICALGYAEVAADPPDPCDGMAPNDPCCAEPVGSRSWPTLGRYTASPGLRRGHFERDQWGLVFVSGADEWFLDGDVSSLAGLMAYPELLVQFQGDFDYWSHSYVVWVWLDARDDANLLAAFGYNHDLEDTLGFSLTVPEDTGQCPWRPNPNDWWNCVRLRSAEVSLPDGTSDVWWSGDAHVGATHTLQLVGARTPAGHHCCDHALTDEVSWLLVANALGSP